MERLAFLPIAIVTALIAIRLDLTYVGLAVLVGMAIPTVSAMRDREIRTTNATGYALIIFGLSLLLIAYFVCAHYGLSFEALDHDRSFPKAVRRLPYFGIALLTSGATAIVISVFRQPKS